MPHTCNGLCSHRQTADSLRALGVEVAYIPDAPFLNKSPARDVELARAKHQAWVDGKIRLCTRTGR